MDDIGASSVPPGAARCCRPHSLPLQVVSSSAQPCLSAALGSLPQWLAKDLSQRLPDSLLEHCFSFLELEDRQAGKLALQGGIHPSLGRLRCRRYPAVALHTPPACSSSNAKSLRHEHKAQSGRGRNGRNICLQLHPA
ncbi:hypothetical protein ABPG75_006786 [Micractinium tetrahymenae]